MITARGASLMRHARAAQAANELAASIRAMLTAGDTDIPETIGVDPETLPRLLADWGLDR